MRMRTGRDDMIINWGEIWGDFAAIVALVVFVFWIFLGVLVFMAPEKWTGNRKDSDKR
jgi:hypothetical protein